MERSVFDGVGRGGNEEPMNLADAPSEVVDNAVHTGHDVEGGMLARVREWVDLLPWLRLLRVVRVAGSPPLLVLVAITLSVWNSGMAGLSRFGTEGVAIRDADNDPAVATSSRILLPSFLAVFQRNASSFDVAPVGSAAPIGLAAPIGSAAAWQRQLAALLWSILLWTPAALVLVRQGALLCAGRDLGGVVSVGRQAVRRSPAAWLVTLFPLLGVLVIGSIFLAAGWLERVAGDLGWFELPVAIGLLLFAIPCGVIATGAIAAIPLGWSAIANERDPDPIDALSRGYEYLYRRPIQVALYALISLVPLLVIDGLSRAIAISAGYICRGMIGDPASSLAIRMTGLLASFPQVVSLTLAWALVGGIYLLLREDAGGQEPEDLWQPEDGGIGTLPKFSSSSHNVLA